MLLAPNLTGAATYQVGLGRTYSNLQALLSNISLQPSDVVQVDGNATYPGNVTFTNSGTATQPITISGVTNGNYPVISGVNGSNGGAVFCLQSDYYIVEHFVISGDTNTARGFYNVGNSNQLRDSVVHDCTNGIGISGATNSGSLTLHNVEVYHCGASTNAHQIYVESDDLNHSNAVFRMEFCFVHDGAGGNNLKSRVARNEIYYNWIEGSPYYELDLVGADPSHQALGTNDNVREDSDVVGNVFYKIASSKSPLARFGSDSIGTSRGRYRFVNNTVVFAPGWSISNGIFKVTSGTNLQTCQSIEMDNNLFHHDGGYGGLQVDTNYFTTVLGANNWVPAGSIIPAGWTNTFYGTDPGFVNAAAFDFRPSPISPLRNAGLVNVTTTNSPFHNPYPLPNPLPAPLFLPPVRTNYPPDFVLTRPVDGPIDIGAFEQTNNVPTIISQPTNQMVNAGCTAVFTVKANGTEPLTYYWMRNGTNLPGATNTTLTLTNVGPANGGQYLVAASNVWGVAYSDTVTLSNVLLSITQQSASVTKTAGDLASFNVVASGGVGAMAYQWQRDGTKLVDDARISGVTTTNLTINPVLTNDAVGANHGYVCVAAPPCGDSITSSVATLTVKPNATGPVVAITNPLVTMKLSNAPVIKGTALGGAKLSLVSVQYAYLSPTNGGTWTAWADATLSSAGSISNWVAAGLTNLQPGGIKFAVKAQNSARNIKAMTNTYMYVVWSPLTVKVSGSGIISTKTTTGGTPPAFTNVAGVGPGSVTNDVQIPGAYYLKATGITTNGVSYLLSNLVLTADGGFYSNVPFTKTCDVTFGMRTNLSVQVSFVTNRFSQCVTGTYWGLFLDADMADPTFEGSGLIKFTVTDGGTKVGTQKVTGKAWIEGQQVGFTMYPDLSGYAPTNTGIMTNKVSHHSYAMTAQVDLDNGNKITGSLSNQMTTKYSEYVAYRSPYGKPPKLFGAPAMAGNYTMVISAGEGGNPAGKGYALVNLGTNGIAVSGRFGDATVIGSMQTSMNVDPEGRWPFYMPMYKDTNTIPLTGLPSAYHGSAFGWLAFTNNVIEGTLTWIKEANDRVVSVKTYAAGFTNNGLVVAGSGWTNSGKDLCFTGFKGVTQPGGVEASGGYVPYGTVAGLVNQPWTNLVGVVGKTNVPVFPLNKVGKGGYTNNLNGVTLVLTASNGKVNGMFYGNDFASETNTFTYEGAILQNQQIAGGLHWVTAGAGKPATNTGPVTVGPYTPGP